MGEAIYILLSKDTILNSKNEYIQNCISRITVQEDMLERKARLAKEEEEERILEEEVRIFKARKGLSKRKKDEDEGTPRKRIRLEENHQKVQQAGKPDSF